MTSIKARRFAGCALLAACLWGTAAIAAPSGAGYHALLKGAEEVPGPGEPRGSGMAEVWIGGPGGAFCYHLKDVTGIGKATMAHIHRGAAGIAGPVVVPLDPPAGGKSTGCPTVAKEVADEIMANPSNFYVNVHTAEHPAGAIRGQLMGHHAP